MTFPESRVHDIESLDSAELGAIRISYSRHDDDSDDDHHASLSQPSTSSRRRYPRRRRDDVAKKSGCLPPCITADAALAALILLNIILGTILVYSYSSAHGSQIASVTTDLTHTHNIKELTLQLLSLRKVTMNIMDPEIWDISHVTDIPAENEDNILQSVLNIALTDPIITTSKQLSNLILLVKETAKSTAYSFAKLQLLQALHRQRLHLNISSSSPEYKATAQSSQSYDSFESDVVTAWSQLNHMNTNDRPIHRNETNCMCGGGLPVILKANFNSFNKPNTLSELLKTLVVSPLNNDDGVYLTIGITSVPRRENPKYLHTLIESLYRQLPSDEQNPLYGRLKIVILGSDSQELTSENNKSRRLANHETFYSAWELLSQLGGPRTHYFVFVENFPRRLDPVPDRPAVNDLENPDYIPGPFVRQQTMDIVSLIDAAVKLSKPKYFLFAEDDFEFCDGILHAIPYIIAKSSYYSPDWLAIRISYGMNGIIMKGKDLMHCAAYLVNHVTILPPDLLFAKYVEELAPRPLIVFRHNLLHHIGVISSLPRPIRIDFPGCYAPMSAAWSLSENETFHNKGCELEDIWPCKLRGRGDSAWTPVDFRSVCLPDPVPTEEVPYVSNLSKHS